MLENIYETPRDLQISTWLESNNERCCPNENWTPLALYE